MATSNFFKTFFTDYYFVRQDANKFDIPKIDISKLKQKYKGLNFEIAETEEWNNDRNRPLLKCYTIYVYKTLDYNEEIYLKFHYGFRCGYYGGVNFDIEIEDCRRYDPYSIKNLEDLQEALNYYGKKGSPKTFYKASLDIIKLLNDAGKEFAENTLIETAKFSTGETMYADIKKLVA